MKKLIVGGLAALAIGLTATPVAHADPSWTMPNLVGTTCRALKTLSSR